jgi:CHAT domain-containing protein
MHKTGTLTESHTPPDPFAVLSDIWTHVVKPVMDFLGLQVCFYLSLKEHSQLTSRLQWGTSCSNNRLYWCPTGEFTLLPLHAAGIYDGPEDCRQCCSDYVVSSYTVTLAALLRAQTKEPLTAPAHLNILTVSEACRTTPFMKLGNVENELIYVGNVANASRHECTVETMPTAATVNSVSTSIESADFVHLACHGIPHQRDALESGFLLSDGMLTVSKLMKLNLGRAWFAYLSACGTAKGNTQHPNLVVHMAVGMLFAGFKSVMATMW